MQSENGEKCYLTCWISVNVTLLLPHLYMRKSYSEASQPFQGHQQLSGVTQALLEVCIEKQDHPGGISSHLLFLLFHINREAESFEIPYESKKVNAWIPCVAQQDAWGFRVALHDADLFPLLLLPCSNTIAGCPEHKSWLSGEGALSEVSDNKVVPL